MQPVNSSVLYSLPSLDTKSLHSTRNAALVGNVLRELSRLKALSPSVPNKEPSMNCLKGFHHSDTFRGGCVAIGNFDGVHRGHQSMVEVLVNLSRERSVPSVVLTFDPHPIEVLRPDQAPPRLSTLARKTELFEELGVDTLIVYPTDRALLDLTPDKFFEDIIREKLDAKGLVEGENFCFGRGRSGDISTLKSLCDTSGVSLHVIEPVTVGESVVSSSEIRASITRGDLAAAVAMLGHPYTLQGVVTKGAERGRTLGFPTANLEQIETLIPGDGVYAGISIVAGNKYAAAVNVGPNPTFGETERKLEVHLIDFSGDLYGSELRVDLFERVRGTVSFGSSEELQRQLLVDINIIRELADQSEWE